MKIKDHFQNMHKKPFKGFAVDPPEGAYRIMMRMLASANFWVATCFSA
jgi:hypothetical protein